MFNLQDFLIFIKHLKNERPFKKTIDPLKKRKVLLDKKREIYEDEDSKRWKKKELEAILQKMIEADAVLLEWSDELWLTLIDKCVAHVDNTITFKFKNGYEIIK